MLRALTFAFWLMLAGPAAAAPFIPSDHFMPVGPAVARGAVVWLHGSYDSEHEQRPPPEPDWLLPLARRGYDMWMFNRMSRQDPLGPGGERLLQGLAALRQAGYRRVIVAGFSRGAFIGLAALARPDLADAVVAISPAAHGPHPERRPQALAEYAARMRAAGATRLALALLRDDPYDPDPAARAAVAEASVPGGAGLLLLIDRPDTPRGHMGSFAPEFERRFGACLAAFLDGAADRLACAGH